MLEFLSPPLRLAAGGCRGPSNAGGWRPSSPCAGPMRDISLFIALVLTHYGYDFSPNRWEAFTAGLGLTCTILLWQRRGKYLTLGWFLCLWGVFESIQVFLCHSFAILEPVIAGRGKGICSVQTGISLYWVGLLAVLMIAAHYLDKGTKNELR